MNSRLLHAAARGVRIQKKIYGEWITVANIWMSSQYDYRIHPDDATLEYGPLSSMLREAADHKTALRISPYAMAAYAILNEDFPGWQIHYENLLHRSLFLLVLAEALADEGL